MWTSQDIGAIAPIAIQKRIPFAISLSEISDYIGNYSLTPNGIPTTPRSKHIIQAIIKEILINQQRTESKEVCIIPPEINSVAASDDESLSICIDSIILPDICNIKKTADGEILATLVQIHPEKGAVRGICAVDFELTEKQVIHLTSQEIIKIPTPVKTKLAITLALTSGTTSLIQNKPLTIPHSKLGLIIDTRENDILVRSSTEISKKLSASWLESFDLMYSEG
ncbi:MAG: hypothetical protein M3Q44_06940 [bacterium]|nr:hypothetical protein [bacterium]